MNESNIELFPVTFSATLENVISHLRARIARGDIESIVCVVTPKDGDVETIASTQQLSSVAHAAFSSGGVLATTISWRKRMIETYEQALASTEHEVLAQAERKLAMIEQGTPGVTLFNNLFTSIMKHEGGYVDIAADRGGPTKYGVTIRTLSSWLGRPATKEDVQDLSLDTAKTIYETLYYKAPGIDRLPAYLQPCAFDACANQGPRNAIRMLQLAVNVARDVGIRVDGVLGEESYAAIDACDDAKLLAEFIRQRLIRYDAIAAQDSTQKVFLRGWQNRLDSFRA